VKHTDALTVSVKKESTHFPCHKTELEALYVVVITN
jgi:hypothetical protein